MPTQQHPWLADDGSSDMPCPHHFLINQQPDVTPPLPDHGCIFQTHSQQDGTNDQQDSALAHAKENKEIEIR